jgi:DNA polymerase-3 subunit chi
MPSRADFYLLSTPSLEASQDFVFRLIEKIYKQGHHFYIHTSDHAAAKQLDNLLWTFNDISFIPHALCDASSNTTQSTAILIGYENHAQINGKILLNLSKQIPEFFSQFQRIIEIVPQQVELQQLGRERFKIYRTHGCEIFTHDLRKK